MNHSFFSRFYPRIIDVVRRDQQFWMHQTKQRGIYLLERSKTRNFAFVYGGSGTLQVNGGEIHSLSEGSIFYFPLGCHIRLAFSPKNPILFYSVHYDYKLLEWEGNSTICKDPSETAGLPFPVTMKVLDYNQFLSSMKQIFDLWQEKNVDYEWSTRLAFLNLLNEVIGLQQQNREGDLAQRSIKLCMDYIKLNYAEPLEREELAEMASLSTSYFSIIFKRVSGYTPTQYITMIRMDKAKQLLQTSALTVSEVARAVGYQDPLYFGKVFASHTSLPPREYRKA